MANPESDNYKPYHPSWFFRYIERGDGALIQIEYNDELLGSVQVDNDQQESLTKCLDESKFKHDIPPVRRNDSEAGRRVSGQRD